MSWQWSKAALDCSMALGLSAAKGMVLSKAVSRSAAKPTQQSKSFI